MWKAQNRRAKGIGLLCALLATGSTLSCTRGAPDAQQQANEKRWANFQKDNKRDMQAGMSAYERRQAQLAAQKKAANAKDAKATATPTPKATGPDTPVK
jgi:hypothetical protein